jgi:ribokinase
MPSRKPINRCKVVVVGGYHTDLLVHTQRLPRPHKACLGSRLQVHGGGRGANCAVAAARAGCSVTFVGAVGGDAFGSMAKGLLSQEGIDLSYLSEVTGIGTGATVGIGDADVIPKLLVVTESANHRISEPMVTAAKEAISSAELVIVEMEIRQETVWFTMDLADTLDVPLLLDAGSAADLRSIPRKPVFVFVAGLPEALESTQTDTIDGAVRALRQAGCSHIALLDGATDVIFSDGETNLRRQAKVEGPVDRYGAHECMEVWFALSLLRGNSLAEAADAGIEGMAYCLQRLGGLSAIPYTQKFSPA